MARMKPGVKKINTVEDADLVLKEIGLLEGELDAIDADAHKRIAEIKTKAAVAGETMRKRVAELAGLLGAFAEYNRDDLFRDRKSLQLSFGVFGSRKSTSISVKKTTLGLLQKLRLDEFIRIKAEPDKERMAGMSDEALHEVDAVRKIKDEFFCEADRASVNAALLKEGA